MIFSHKAIGKIRSEDKPDVIGCTAMTPDRPQCGDPARGSGKEQVSFAPAVQRGLA
jgi:hypothetical protein